MSDTQHSELLPWQRESYDHLCKLEETNRLAHAYLFEGLEGIGKISLARLMASRILCHHPVSNMPCGNCTACHLLAAGSHPDLQEVSPLEGKRDVSVDQVRDILAVLANKSMHGGRKVVILYPAESMNINAANALLKGLEEPAAGTLLILFSHQPGLLLATIRSRCQQLRLTVPQHSMALEWLHSKKISTSAEELLALANGAPIKALELADEDALHERSVLHDVLLGLLQSRLNPFAAAAECMLFAIEDNVEGMALCVSDLLSHIQSQGKRELREKDLEPMVQALQGEQIVSRLHRFYQQLIAARNAIISKTNPNSQLLLESLFGHWQQLARLS